MIVHLARRMKVRPHLGERGERGGQAPSELADRHFDLAKDEEGPLRRSKPSGFMSTPPIGARQERTLLSPSGITPMPSSAGPLRHGNTLRQTFRYPSLSRKHILHCSEYSIGSPDRRRADS